MEDKKVRLTKQQIQMPAFPYELIDLTHALDERSPAWEEGCGFHLDIKDDYAPTSEALTFRIQHLHMRAGIGTHMDAPAHCVAGGRTIEGFTLQELIVPCYCINVSEKAQPDYQVSGEDLIAFEEGYGPIEKGSLVIIHTGWGQYWSLPAQYRNNLQFPTISSEAAHFLLDRDIVGLGIDTLSPDLPTSGFPVHKALLSADKYIIENIANSGLVPPAGSYAGALPLKGVGLTEAPVRLICFLPK